MYIYMQETPTTNIANKHTEIEKKEQGIMWNKNIPTDLTEDILCRLPVKGLLRFRCVSKPWCSLIDDPNFIKLHLKKSIETSMNDSLVLISGKKLRSTDLDLLGNPKKLDHPLKRTKTPIRVLGTSNGLLCLSNEIQKTVLWNMSTRKHHFLPDMPVNYIGSCMIRVYGFAYDAINDDYKVLWIVQRGLRDYLEPEVNVYSLRTNAWRRISLCFPYKYASGNLMMGMHSNGALHWVVSHDLGCPSFLIAFDLALENFRKLPLPDRIGAVLLGVLGGGCLCLAKTNENVCVDIWVMKVYGVKDSWSKLFSVALEGVQSIAYLTPIRSDKVLLKHRGKNVLYCYDLKNKRAEQFSMPGPWKSYYPIVCPGSLVPLNDP